MLLAEQGRRGRRYGQAGETAVAARTFALVHADALFAILKAAAGPLALQHVDALAVHAAGDPVHFAEHLLTLTIDCAGTG